MPKIKVAINGFGRIGRNVFKIAIDKPNLEIVEKIVQTLHLTPKATPEMIKKATGEIRFRFYLY
ncbi:unnamed protein product, partial [marine sediment metagenome]